MPQSMTAHSALVHIMVLAACADERIVDAEIRQMTEIIGAWPVFGSYDVATLRGDTESCLAYLERKDGIDELLHDVTAALPERLSETAYALACDIVAADGAALQPELEALMLIRQALGVGRLPAAAIERGARARALTL